MVVSVKFACETEPEPLELKDTVLITNTRRISGCKDTEIGISCPSLLLEVEQAKAQVYGKVKSYVFSFLREEQLAEIPNSWTNTCWNTLRALRNLSQTLARTLYLPADLFIKEYFQWEVQQTVLIFLSWNIKFSSHTKHLTFYFKKFYMVGHFIYLSTETTTFMYQCC